jgi:hypothetical protein
MRSTYIREVHANLIAQKHHDDNERRVAGMDFARRVLLTDTARIANGGTAGQRAASSK